MSSSISSGTADWLYKANYKQDLRLYYLKCNADGSFGNHIDWDPCNVKQMSPISNLPMCFSTEAGKAAQVGVWVSMALHQISIILIVKTRKASLIYSGLRNFTLNFGFMWIICVTIVITYAHGVNVGLNTRPLTFLHYAFPSVPFVIFISLFDEARKFLMRIMKRGQFGNNWLERNTFW